MKQLLTNPIIVSLEINLVEDIIKIITNAIHPKVAHGDVNGVLNELINAKNQAQLPQPQETQKSK